MLKRKITFSRCMMKLIPDTNLSADELLKKYKKDIDFMKEELLWYAIFRGRVISKPMVTIGTYGYLPNKFISVFITGIFIGRKKAMQWYNNKKYLPEINTGQTYNI